MADPKQPSGDKSTLDLNLTWHTLNSEDVLERLHSLRDTGLTSAEAVRRQESYGLNQLKEGKRKTFLGMVIDQLNNFVVILLIVAAIISAFLGEGIDAGAIIIIVILNTVMGVVQESRAENALAALKKMAAPEAQVLRDGHRVSIPARELVPGDIVYLETGNFIPADVRLLEAVNLRIE
jgi:Ca2+-transporting ATPase